MTDTTPVTSLTEAVSSSTQASKQGFRSIWARLIRLTKSRFISLAPSVGTTFSYSHSKTQFPSTFYIQMESNQDSAALAQQVQTLAATVEELTKQNQEMKLRLQ